MTARRDLRRSQAIVHAALFYLDAVGAADDDRAQVQVRLDERGWPVAAQIGEGGELAGDEPLCTFLPSIEREEMHSPVDMEVNEVGERPWTPAEDLILVEGLVAGRLLDPVMEQLNRGQADCLARFDALVGMPQTERVLREALDRARGAAA